MDSQSNPRVLWANRWRVRQQPGPLPSSTIPPTNPRLVRFWTDRVYRGLRRCADQFQHAGQAVHGTWMEHYSMRQVQLEEVHQLLIRGAIFMGGALQLQHRRHIEGSRRNWRLCAFLQMGLRAIAANLDWMQRYSDCVKRRLLLVGVRSSQDWHISYTCSS